MSYLRRDPNFREFFLVRTNAIDLDQFLSSNLDVVFFLYRNIYAFFSFRFGAPVFISFPHFYLADSYYTSMVEGLKPDAEKHRTYMRIEPESGVPTEVNIRLSYD